MQLLPVADPDLELRGGGGGGVLIYLPWRPFSFQSFLLFFTQNKGGRQATRAPPLDPPLTATITEIKWMYVPGLLEKSTSS